MQCIHAYQTQLQTLRKPTILAHHGLTLSRHRIIQTQMRVQIRAHQRAARIGAQEACFAVEERFRAQGDVLAWEGGEPAGPGFDFLVGVVSWVDDAVGSGVWWVWVVGVGCCAGLWERWCGGG